MGTYKGTITYQIDAENAHDAMQLLLKNFNKGNQKDIHLLDINFSISQPQEEQQKKLLRQEQQRIHNKYPDNIMRKLREAQGLDEDDISHDEELNTLSPSEAFEEVLNFEGYINCAHSIKSIIQDIYSINIDKLGTSLSQANIYPTEIDSSDISPIQAYINALNQNKPYAEHSIQEEIQ